MCFQATLSLIFLKGHLITYFSKRGIHNTYWCHFDQANFHFFLNTTQQQSTIYCVYVKSRYILIMHFKCHIFFSGIIYTLFGDVFSDNVFFFISFTRRGMKNTSSICRELLDLSSSSWTFVRPSLPSFEFYSALSMFRVANN